MYYSQRQQGLGSRGVRSWVATLVAVVGEGWVAAMVGGGGQMAAVVAMGRSWVAAVVLVCRAWVAAVVVVGRGRVAQIY